VTDESELEALCAEISSQHHSGESPDSPSRPCCTFTYVTMTGEEVELCQGGHSLTVRYTPAQLISTAHVLVAAIFMQWTLPESHSTLQCVFIVYTSHVCLCVFVCVCVCVC